MQLYKKRFYFLQISDNCYNNCFKNQRKQKKVLILLTIYTLIVESLHRNKIHNVTINCCYFLDVVQEKCTAYNLQGRISCLSLYHESGCYLTGCYFK